MATTQQQLTVVILHPNELQARGQSIQQCVQMIHQACQRLNVQVSVRQVPQLKHPLLLHKELKGRIAPKPTGVEVIDDWMDDTQRSLDAYQVSHWFHHEVCFRASIESDPKISSNHILWVLEDDTVFVERSVETLVQTLRPILNNPHWKFLYTGACTLNPVQQKDTPSILRTVDTQKPPTSCESFMVRVSRVKEMLPDMETIRCTHAGFLWWMSCKYPEDTFGLAKALTIDGSKMGIFPSSISTLSVPLLNHDYRQLIALLGQPAGPENKQQLKTIVNKLKKIQCANGILPYIRHLQTEGKHEEALELTEEAFQWKASRNGLMDPSCPLLQIILDHYRNENTKTIVEARKTPSKFANRLPVA